VRCQADPHAGLEGSREGVRRGEFRWREMHNLEIKGTPPKKREK
jgi:hypothetical protein